MNYYYYSLGEETDSHDHSDHSDHSDYSDYGDYGDEYKCNYCGTPGECYCEKAREYQYYSTEDSDDDRYIPPIPYECRPIENWDT
jgi:hypothetical protein